MYIRGLRNIVENELGLRKVGRVIHELGCLGDQTRTFIQAKVSEMSKKKQYVAACVLSTDEIYNESDQVFAEAHRFLGSRKARCPYAYVSYKRAAVLMNHPDSMAHGEVRLLDPSREILDDILPYRQEMGEDDLDEDLMEKMNRQFRQANGWQNTPIIFILSHYIPCTEPDYTCSAVIREFVERTGAFVIVAYEHMYEETDTIEALYNLEHENVYVLDLTEIQQPQYEEAHRVQFREERRRSRRWRRPLGVTGWVPDRWLIHLNFAQFEIAEWFENRRGRLRVVINIKPW